jgi:hypothetical protein
VARLSCKPGVQPPLIRLLCGVANVAAHLDCVSEVVITSGNDGKHQPHSLHYENAAIDIRTKNFPDERAKTAFLNALRDELGEEDYDFLYEQPGKPGEHLHVEYDPRRH